MPPPISTRMPVDQPTGWRAFWAETWVTALLALPIIFGQVLQHALSVVDILMVGRVSVEAVAAASLAGAMFGVPLVFGFGVMGPFSVFVARAAARGESLEAVHQLRRGLAVSLVLGVSLAAIITVFSGYLDLLDQPRAVLAQAKPFLLLLTWSIIPMYLFQILKQFCEALHAPWPPMIILTTGVLINVALNWVFIFGNLGFPALGLLGAGWATFIARVLTVIILGFVVFRMHLRDAALRHGFLTGSFHWQGYKNLLAMGLPAGSLVILEAGAFSFAAIMMGWLSDAALAAHQIALCVAGMTFMVPLGLSMAVAIRVGHALGAHDFQRARRSIWGSLLLTLLFMTFTATTICLFCHPLARAFISDPKTVAVAAQVLIVAGLFQIFDGPQIVCLGALRGLHDVKIPTLIVIGAYWLIGIPASALLAFHFHVGPVGIWIGLLIGLAIVAVLQLLRLRWVLAKVLNSHGIPK